MTRLDNEKFKNGNYKIENRLKTSDKRHEAKSKALQAKVGSSFDRMNKERKSQGYRPVKDRATKGLYEFLDK